MSEDPMKCECGHYASEHSAIESCRCLYGFNAAVQRYTDGRRGNRKCDCEAFRLATPSPDGAA